MQENYPTKGKVYDETTGTFIKVEPSNNDPFSQHENPTPPLLEVLQPKVRLTLHLEHEFEGVWHTVHSAVVPLPIENCPGLNSHSKLLMGLGSSLDGSASDGFNSDVEVSYT